MKKDVTNRFSDRVRDYILYRPGYPTDIIVYMSKACGLKSSDSIADIGSGTGMLSEIFLNNGNTVFAVEPNDGMRFAAEAQHGHNPGFLSTYGKAEATGLEDKSVKFIVAGQAFHWFDQKKAKTEFQRILIPGGYIILIWNERDINLDGFMGEYDQFLKEHSTDYSEIDHRNITGEALSDFFAPGNYKIKEFDNKQIFDFTGLKGRYDSCSYAYPSNHTRYELSIQDLRLLFDKYQIEGKVEMLYKTRLYCGCFVD